MSKAAANKTTPAAMSGSAITSVTHDELAALGDMDFGDDGIGPLAPEDIKIAAKVLNMKGVNAEGRKLPEDEYYDTVHETTKPKINAVFLLRHKTRLYSYFDNEKKETVIVCRSQDQVMGTMDSGVKRPCNGCPDYEWRQVQDKDGKTKRKRNCSQVVNVFALDRDDQQPFVYRFKKTSLPIITTYLQRHFIGQRVVNGQRLHYPLYVFATEMTVKHNGTYGAPVLTRGPLLSRAEIETAKLACETLRTTILPAFAQVEEHAERRAGAADSGEPDTSFDPDRFGGSEGQDFVDETK